MRFLIILLSLLVSFSLNAQVMPKVDKVTIGNPRSSADKTIEFDLGAGNPKPKIRANKTTTELEFTNDGVNFKKFGSGSGGGDVNYIVNGDAEGANPFLVTKNTAAGARPDTGFVTTGVTIAATIPSTGPPAALNGSKSFLLSKPASNAQGQQFYVPFTIPEKYREKPAVFNIKMPYRVASGTFNYGSYQVGGADGDLIVYVAAYNSATTQWELIEPTGYKFDGSDIDGTFQSRYNITSYRLLFHVASTNASAWGLQVDDIEVSPAKYAYGTPISDWKMYTPTITGLGTISNEGALWRQVGDSLEIKGTVIAGTTTASTFSWGLPPGLNVDPNKNPSTSNSASHGLAYNLSATTTGYASTNPGPFPVFSDTSVSTAVLYVANNNSASRFSKANGNTLWNSGDRVRFEAEGIPISGWSSSIQTSDQSDGRKILLSAYRTGTQAIASGTPTAISGYNGTASDFVDTHGGLNPTTGLYTFRTGGLCTVNGTAYWAGGGTGARVVLIRKNGTVSRSSYTNNPNAADYTLNVSYSDRFVVGDTLDLAVFQNSGGNVNLNNGTSTNISGSFNIDCNGATSTIAASSSVTASYTTTSAQSIPNAVSTVIDFGTKVDDSFGAVTTGAAWKFTARLSGVYQVCASISYSLTPSSANSLFSLQANKNGVFHRMLNERIAMLTASQNIGLTGCTNIRMVSDDYISVSAYQADGGARSLNPSTGYNHISIHRVGN